MDLSGKKNKENISRNRDYKLILQKHPIKMFNTSNKRVLCSEDTKLEFCAQAAFLVLILLATVFGNVLVIATVCLSRQIRSITANYFVVNLAVSDLLVALVSLPLRLDQTIHNMNWCLSEDACALWIWSDMICSAASISNLAVISIDRFQALSSPLHYEMKMTKRVAYGLIVFVWLYSLLWACLGFINWSEPGAASIHIYQECGKSDSVYYTVTMTTGFLVPLSIFVVNYVRIFVIARHQANSIAKDTPTLYAEKNLKAAKTIAIVGCTFIISWLPFTIIFIVSLWCRRCIERLYSNKVAALLVKMVFVYTLPAINSACNPAIYALYNQEFRKAMKKTILRMSFRQKLPEEIAMNASSQRRSRGCSGTTELS